MINRSLIVDAYNENKCSLYIRCPKKEYTKPILEKLSSFGITFDGDENDLHMNYWNSYKKNTIFIIKHRALGSPEFRLLYGNYQNVEIYERYRIEDYFEIPFKEFIPDMNINKQTWKYLLDF